MNIDLSGINQLSKKSKQRQSTGFTVIVVLSIAVAVKAIEILVCL
jgi:hypothetical protein